VIVVKDNRGQGLALVIIITAFIFVMGSGAVALATSLRRNAGMEICQKKAYYIAEAGIEKAISIVRSGQLSSGFPESDQVVDLVTEHISSAYAGGSIEHVKVSRESRESGNNSELILIESWGTYQEACCILQAMIRVDRSLDFGRGLCISSPSEKPSVFSPGCRIISELYNTDGALNISDSTVNGDIYTGGDLTMSGDTHLAGDINGEGMFTACPNCRVVGNVQMTGDVQVEDDVVIEGDIRAAGDVYIRKAVVSGSIWSNGEIFVEQGGQVEGGIYPGQAMELDVALPFFPEVDLSFFRRGADQILKGTQQLHGILHFDGVTFIEGDLEIAGDYTGKGILVVDGSVGISGDLLPVGIQDSLCILAAGPVTCADGSCLSLLVYGKDDLSLGEGSRFQGSITAYTLWMCNNAEFIYDGDLVDNFLPSSFVTVSILSWKKGSR
jgi:cytoskeletal protein CcmA (bactofilin family)